MQNRMQQNMTEVIKEGNDEELMKQRRHEFLKKRMYQILEDGKTGRSQMPEDYFRYVKKLLDRMEEDIEKE